MADSSVVTNLGRASAASRINSAGTVWGWLSLSTGETAGTSPAVTDTTLTTPLGARVAGSTSTVTTTVAGDTFQNVATFPGSTYAGTVTAVGLFDALTAGSLVAKTILGANQVILAADSYVITYQIKFS